MLLSATRQRGLWSSLQRPSFLCVHSCRIHSTKYLWQDQDEQRKQRSIDYKLRGKGRQFVDFMRVVARGGNGGDGCVSFHREKFLAKGPPNGGNGGRGGSVIIRASSDETTLRRLGRACTGKRGENGLGGGRHGTKGDDLVIQVPIGTIVREVAPPATTTNKDEDEEEEEEYELDEREKRDKRWVYYPRMDLDQHEHTMATTGRKNYFLEAERMMDEEEKYLKWRERKERQQGPIYADLAEHDQQVIVCYGGLGGYGNPHFLTTDNRSPKWATRGRAGEQRSLTLELKTIADIGLVGLPNAGKSTLLGSISNAHPKQAAYAFTTLHPFVGTVDYADQYQLTVADIPGLIQGAHRNVGLGHAFLRHVERAKLLVYVVDLGGKAPWDDLKILQNELEQYRPGLTKRQSLIVANKADQVAMAKGNLAMLEEKVRGDNIPVVPVSAKYEKNILKLTAILRKNVERIRQQEIEQRQKQQQQHDLDE